MRLNLEPLEGRESPSSVGPDVVQPIVTGQVVLHAGRIGAYGDAPTPVELWLGGSAPMPKADKLERSLVGPLTVIRGFDLAPAPLPAAAPAELPGLSPAAVDAAFSPLDLVQIVSVLANSTRDAASL